MRTARLFVRFAPVAAVLALGITSARSARAEADTFGLGSGRSGPGTIAATTVVNAYASVTANVAAGASSVTVDSGASFTPGDLVMVWEATGLEAATSGRNLLGVDLALSSAGTYELARVKSVVGNVVTFTNPLLRAYVGGDAQLVRMPEYTTLTITAGGITATPWDGTKGGIVAFLVQGAIANAGTIDADASGFRGGVLKNDDKVFGCTAGDGPVVDSAITPGLNALAGGAKKGEGIFPADFSVDITNPTAVANAVTYGRNNVVTGGGGGDCHNSGGGGGGHGGVGGQGAGTWAGETDLVIPTPDRMVGGLGGDKLVYDPTAHLVFGGGGGAGEENDDVGSGGAIGGGVVFVRAGSITGTGTITADGAAGAPSTNDGAGGGGAGGLIMVRTASAADCSALHANGGAGGASATDHGPGGGGAGGVVYFQSASGTCAALATETGGAKGLDGAGLDRGSTNGDDGVTATVPAGGFTPTGCDIVGGECGGCVQTTDCPSGDTCNTTTNQCDFPDGGVDDGGLGVPDAGPIDAGADAGDGGSGDGGLTDGGAGNDGGSSDGGFTDGGSRDGGSNADGGGSFGDGGNGGEGDGGGGLFGDGTLEGGGCGCSTPGSSDGENAGAFTMAAFAALAFVRRKRKK